MTSTTAPTDAPAAPVAQTTSNPEPREPAARSPFLLKWAWLLGPTLALGSAIAGWLLGARMHGFSESFDAYADKVLAGALALAVYLSTTLMRIKERRGDYRREIMKEHHKPESRAFVAWAHRKAGERTNEARWLVLPDSVLTTLTVVLIIRIAVRGSTDVAVASTRWPKAIAAADGAVAALVMASVVALVLFHWRQWRQLQHAGAGLPPAPPATPAAPPPTMAASLNGLTIDAQKVGDRMTVAFSSTGVDATAKARAAGE